MIDTRGNFVDDGIRFCWPKDPRKISAIERKLFGTAAIVGALLGALLIVSKVRGW